MWPLRFQVVHLILALGTVSCVRVAEQPTESSVTSPAARRAADGIQPHGLRAHLGFLADDLLEGREAGTRGYRLAARYVAAQFQAAGLNPAGIDGTFYQPVPLRASRLVLDRSWLKLWREGWVKELVLGEDYVTTGSVTSEEMQVRAPLVFVGFGVTAPELDYDDYHGAEDTEGKIVVTLSGAPASFPSNQRAYYSRSKIENAAAHGAVGLVSIRAPSDEARRPWSALSRRSDRAVMSWLDDSGAPANASPQIRANVVMNRRAATEIFNRAPMSLEEVFDAAASDELEPFDLPVEVEAHTVSRHEETESPNVVAKIEGFDPTLKNEHVVFTAHLDHVGTGEPIDGDDIWNGAYDNASGASALIEVAKAFARLPAPPRRSVLFLATTAEEKGLLGADYFAHRPTVPKESLVANINMDGVLMLYPFQDLIIYGGEHSSLGAAFEAVAQELDIEISPDPMPEEVIFVRSDQFAFVRQGIPAAYAFVGTRSMDPEIDGMEALREWIATRYHTPKDDLGQEMDWTSGARYTRVNFLAGYRVAQQDASPTWNEGDFFGEKFGGGE